MPKNAQRNQKFERIVIAIIAILASMILPALRSAIDKARAIQCTSNHKQLSTTTHLYTDDNRGYMPYHPNDAPKMEYPYGGSGHPKWSTYIWSYATRKPITSDYAFNTVNGKQWPKIEMLRCPAVLEPFDYTVEMRHIGRNYFFEGSFAINLFVSNCRWPSERMLYSDYESTVGYTVCVANHTAPGNAYANSYITYLHPGLTATITYLDGHVKASSLASVPLYQWDSRFWGVGNNGISRGTKR